MRSSFAAQLPRSRRRALTGAVGSEFRLWEREGLESSSRTGIVRAIAWPNDAWQSEQRARDEALLQEAGLDPARLQGMSLEEIDGWLEAQQADPVKKARMEALMQANPDQRALAITNLETMERDSVKLLEREDAHALLLPPLEVEPWLAALSQRWASVPDLLSQLPAGAPPDEATTKALAEAIAPVVREMAQSIFTPGRIQQLTSQLKKCRSELFAAGDKAAANCAMGAIASLEREDDPSQNYFLNTLCFASLRSFTGAGAGSDTEDEGATPPRRAGKLNHVAQASQPAGWRSILASRPKTTKQGARMLPSPARKDACATARHCPRQAAFEVPQVRAKHNRDCSISNPPAGRTDAH